MIDGFTMFNNYHIAAKEYAAGDLAIYGRLMMIINTYALDGVLLDDLTPVEKLFITSLKASLDKSREMRARGQKGGRPKTNNNNNLGFNSGFNQGFTSGFNEVEVEVEVEKELDIDKEVEVEVESKNTTDDFKKNKNDLIEFVTEFQNKHGFNFGKKTINKLIELAPTLSFEDQLNYIKSKYPDKSGDELARLFVASLNWPEVKPKEEKKTKKPNLDIYKTAPKTCSRCGAKIVKWVGVPNAVICENCKTYWELEINEWGGNEWKCSRGA